MTKNKTIALEMISAGNLKEYSFGYEGKIEYNFNTKTQEVYLKSFKEPISFTLLKAILKDLEKKIKKVDFKEQLWEEVKKRYKVEKNPLFNGNPNPETGKRENVYTLDLQGDMTYFVCKEVIEE